MRARVVRQIERPLEGDKGLWTIAGGKFKLALQERDVERRGVTRTSLGRLVENGQGPVNRAAVGGLRSQRDVAVRNGTARWQIGENLLSSRCPAGIRAEANRHREVDESRVGGKRFGSRRAPVGGDGQIDG